MAKAKGKNVVVEEVEELDDDELEDLDLEDLADEEVEEDEDVEEESEDEDEPKPKARRKGKAKAKKKESDSIGSAELAEALDVSGRELRVLLRSKGVKKNANNRYEWESVDDALEQLGFDDLDAAQEALSESRNERLEELKDKSAKKRAAKKKAKAKAQEADDDEDEDDEEEEEEETPKPKSRRRKTTSKK